MAVRSTALPLLAALAGCGAVQHAVVHVPSVDQSFASAPYADGIVVGTPDLCFSVEETETSADYNNLAAGPLGIPLFPLGIMDPAVRDRSFFAVYIKYQPKRPGVTFDPSQLKLRFPTGTEYSPKYFRERPQPAPGVSVAEIIFDKPSNDTSPDSLSTAGFYLSGSPIPLPRISFSRQSKARIVFSGQTINGAYLSDRGKPICGFLDR